MCKESAEEATSVLREYVRNGIPVIKSSEMSFLGLQLLANIHTERCNDIFSYKYLLAGGIHRFYA